MPSTVRTVLEPRRPILRRLPPAELRRRLWHVAPGFLPALLWVVPHRDPIGMPARLAILAIACGTAAAIFYGYRRIARPGDGERLPAVAGYAGSVLLTLLAFPGDIEIGLTVLAVLAFGDGTATAGGLLLGGPSLPWNPRKTWAGLTCFLVAGGSAAAFLHWAERTFNPASVPASVPLGVSLACGIASALVGAIVESVPSRVNDNIRVGFAAAVTAAAVHLPLVHL